MVLKLPFKLKDPSDEACIDRLVKWEKTFNVFAEAGKRCNLALYDLIDPVPPSRYINNKYVLSRIENMLEERSHILLPYGYILVGLVYVVGSKVDFKITTKILEIAELELQLNKGIRKRELVMSNCYTALKPECVDTPNYLYPDKEVINYGIYLGLRMNRKKREKVENMLRNVIPHIDSMVDDNRYIEIPIGFYNIT